MSFRATVSHTTSFCGAIALALIELPMFVAAASAETDPLSDRLTSVDEGLCFARDYDAAHLRKNPGQLTQAAMLSFKSDGLRVMLRLKNRPAPVYMVATCEWNPKTAGINTRGEAMIPSFKKGRGYDCIVILSPGSAQEGGYVLLDPAPDGQAVTLHADTPVQVRASLDNNAKVFALNLGQGDRTFRMTRTDPSACRAMEQALDGM